MNPAASALECARTAQTQTQAQTRARASGRSGEVTITVVPSEPSSYATIMPRSFASAKKTRAALRAFALGLPGAFEAFPWGECVVKVNKKVFVFFGTDEPNPKTFGMSVKLPESADIVLALPFAKPTGYGLGKSGWVPLIFEPREAPPLSVLEEWLLESYYAIAPKRVAAKPTPVLTRLSGRRPTDKVR